MKAMVSPLSELLSKQVQYVIPVFQRQYRWERPQWERLWSSIQDFRSAERTGNHFMGFLVAMQSGVPLLGQLNRYFLIDGQQRLTTLTLLLAALRNTALKLRDSDLGGEIEDLYLTHPRKKDEQRYRLLPKALDRDALTAIVDGKQAPEGRMSEALRYFQSELEAAHESDPKALAEVFHVVTQRLDFMSAVLDGENAYSIFKGLNSTGVPLGQSDLIRNFVFMHVNPDDQDAFDDLVWSPLEDKFADTNGRLDEDRFSKFFRDMLMADGQYVQPQDTFATFEARHEATGFDPVKLAAQLTADAAHYAVISGEMPDADPQVAIAIRALNDLESSTTYPLLIALYRHRAAGRISSLDLSTGVNMLRGFILRRLISGENSRSYGQMFVRALADDDGAPITTLEHYLLERGWPHDARFREAFPLFPLYRSGYARHVLESIERSNGHKEQADLKQAQIEHVMPQTLSGEWASALGDEYERIHADWLHRPGNLTLTAYNQEVGNLPYGIKRTRFAQSNIGLTKDIASNEVWTEREIQKRGEALAAIAEQLWVGPVRPYVSERPPVQVEETQVVRLSFWQGFKDYMEKHHPEVPDFVPSRFRCVKLKSPIARVAIEARFKVHANSVHLDVYFKQSAVRLWIKLSGDAQPVDALMGAKWAFEQAPKKAYGWMTLSKDMPDEGAKHWPSLYGWLGQRLSDMYRVLIPYLDQEMAIVAPRIVKQPDESGKAKSATKLQQQRFWGVLADEIRSRETALKPQKPLPQHWTNYAVGRSGIALAPTLNSKEDRIAVELSIGSLQAKEHFHALHAQREAVENEFGGALDWQEMPDKQMSRVMLARPDSDPLDESRWPEYVQWLADSMVRMDEVFRKRVQALP